MLMLILEYVPLLPEIRQSRKEKLCNTMVTTSATLFVRAFLPHYGTTGIDINYVQNR
jgi:hypothetical protein